MQDTMAAASTGRERILSKVRERIVAYASSRIGLEAAEDLAQDTLMLLETKYRHLSEADDLVPLGVRIMQFKIRERKRDRLSAAASSDDLPLEDQAPDPERTARYAELHGRLMAAMEQLGDRCRRLFLLKLDGYNFEEIKERMAANTLQAVYTWDFRCRQDLKKILKQMEKRG